MNTKLVFLYSVLSIFFPISLGDEVLLKNHLLESLNSFFGSPGESLEILDGSPEVENSVDQETGNSLSSDFSNNDIIVDEVFEKAIQPSENSINTFPTLIATEATTPMVPEKRNAVTIEKTRSEGPITSEKTLDSIRDWRKRLYKAFKGRKMKPTSVVRVTDHTNRPNKIPSSEILEFTDEMPLVVDKNRQVILSRTEPNWNQMAAKPVQTFGKDPQGKIVRLFGTQRSGYKYNKMESGAPSQVPNSYLPLSSLHRMGDVRQSYRTLDNQPVVYLPAPPAQQVYHPAPATVHLVTATAPPLLTLPPMWTPPNVPQFPTPQDATPPPQFRNYPQPAQQPQFGQQPNYNGQTEPNYNEQPPNYNTQPPPNYNQPSFTNNQQNLVEDQDLRNEEDSLDEMFGQTFEENNDCAGGCPMTDDGQIISEEKCNSMRLQNIIQNNIVSNDAESSKRAVQLAAEAETGTYFDAVCGTGFFSYIAHTDEFCLASSMGVNCYVFSPVCSGDFMIFAKRRLSKTKKKVFVNRN